MKFCGFWDVKKLCMKKKRGCFGKSILFFCVETNVFVKLSEEIKLVLTLPKRENV